ncbi:group III truncated hemoglobin [Flavobacterium sp.]|uniref:group III truncated hemoglobin n=1 Tax=Flavobacterium sp. TaxID=239 RepID=UPI003D10939E
MSKRDIDSRNDVELLVHSFYIKIRQDLEIGPFFNQVISDWEEHLEKLVNFWESTLFGTRNYSGNPILAHIAVDEKFKGTVSPTLFGIWLNYWLQTIDEHFEGDNAIVLKNRASKIGTVLMVNIFENRKVKSV